MRTTFVTAAALAACGGGGGGGPDASPAHGSVTVHVRDRMGTPRAGIPVVFVDSDQTQIMTSDASGIASAEIATGGSVSGVFATSNRPWIESVLSIEPGDDIVLGGVDPDYTTTGTFSVTVPASSSSVTVRHPCGAMSSNTSPVELTLAHWCVQNPMELMLTAQEGYIDTMVPFTPSGTTTVSGPYQPYVDVTATFTNISTDDVKGLSFTWVAGGSPAQATVQNPTSQETLHVRGAIGTSNAASTAVGNAAHAVQYVSEPVSPTTTSVNVDVSHRLLPWLQTPMFDPSTRVLRVPTLEQNTSGDAIDLFAGGVGYDATGARHVQWLVYTDRLGDIQLPELPMSVVDLTPAAMPAPSIWFAMAIEEDELAGYDAARHNVYDVYQPVRLPAGRRVSMPPP